MPLLLLCLCYQFLIAPRILYSHSPYMQLWTCVTSSSSEVENPPSTNGQQMPLDNLRIRKDFYSFIAHQLSANIFSSLSHPLWNYSLLFVSCISKAQGGFPVVAHFPNALKAILAQKDAHNSVSRSYRKGCKKLNSFSLVAARKLLKIRSWNQTTAAKSGNAKKLSFLSCWMEVQFAPFWTA